MAIGSGLALVAGAIILVLRFRPGRVNGAAHRRHKQRTYLSAPHLPLDQQRREVPDECIDLEEKDPDVIPVNKGKVARISIGKRSAIMASTACLSLGELMVNPNDSDITWRSDGHF